MLLLSAAGRSAQKVAGERAGGTPAPRQHPSPEIQPYLRNSSRARSSARPGSRLGSVHDAATRTMGPACVFPASSMVPICVKLPNHCEKHFYTGALGSRSVLQESAGVVRRWLDVRPVIYIRILYLSECSSAVYT